MKIYAVKASGILAETYSLLKGKLPEQICYQLGIEIRINPWLRSDRAYLKKTEDHSHYIVDLPITNFKLKSDYLIYHELAHVFLLERGIPAPLGKEEYWTVETWCDNFAFAMITSLFDVDVVGERNASDFFNQSVNTSNTETPNKQTVERFRLLLIKKRIPAELQKLVDSLL